MNTHFRQKQKQKEKAYVIEFSIRLVISFEDLNLENQCSIGNK